MVVNCPAPVALAKRLDLEYVAVCNTEAPRWQPEVDGVLFSSGRFLERLLHAAVLHCV